MRLIILFLFAFPCIASAQNVLISDTADLAPPATLSVVGSVLVGEPGVTWNIDSLGNYSAAFGRNTQAGGQASSAFGWGSRAIGENSFALGVDTEVNSYAEVAFGRWNDSPSSGNAAAWSSGDQLFSIGVGTSDLNRTNAMEVQKNGTIRFNAQSGSIFGVVIDNPGDVNLSSTAPLMLGSPFQPNLVMDRDEIMARNFFNPATLYLNRDGGTVFVGGNIRTVDTIFADDNVVADGVINAGGAISPSLNILAESADQTIVAGSNDLFIGDALEIGGEAYKPGGGDWQTISDARLKTDVRDFRDGLDKVMQIRPVAYKYNNTFDGINNGKEYVGVLAQDMLEIAPYMISLESFGQITSEDEEGNEHIVQPGSEYYTYDASALPYMLVNAVKEQQLMITDQQAIIDAQQVQLESQSAIIDELLERVEALEDQ